MACSPNCYLQHTVAGERNIQALNIRCDNDKNGCQWIGQLCSLDDHLSTCGFVFVNCPNGCMQQQSDKEVLEESYILRYQLGDHLRNGCPNRSYKCPHCKESGKYFEIMNSHLKTCPRVKVPCPNNCGATALRYNLIQHRSICRNELVRCRYAELGCYTHVLRRRFLKKHEHNDTVHLHLALETVMKLKRKMQEIRTAPVFKMSEYARYKAENLEWFSPGFYSHPGGYKLCIVVNPSGDREGKRTHLSVYVLMMCGENDDKLLWPFSGKVEVELLNQLDDKNHRKDMFIYDSKADELSGQRVTDRELGIHYYGETEFVRNSDLEYNAERGCQYLMDDCLHFRVSVEVDSVNKPWLTAFD